MGGGERRLVRSNVWVKGVGEGGEVSLVCGEGVGGVRFGAGDAAREVRIVVEEVEV